MRKEKKKSIPNHFIHSLGKALTQRHRQQIYHETKLGHHYGDAGGFPDTLDVSERESDSLYVIDLLSGGHEDQKSGFAQSEFMS